MELSLTLIFIVTCVLVSLAAWNKPDLMQKMVMNPYRIYLDREYHRFLTHGLVHNDYMHLFFNMFALYFFGSKIEYIFTYYYGVAGTLYYILLFLGGFIVSNIPTYIKHKSNPYYVSLGASGGVAAVVFSTILFDPLSKIYIYGIIGIPGFILGALYIMYSYYQDRNGESDGIGHSAHLYGALYGLGFAAILEPAAIPSFFQQIATWTL